MEIKFVCGGFHATLFKSFILAAAIVLLAGPLFAQISVPEIPLIPRPTF